MEVLSMLRVKNFPKGKEISDWKEVRCPICGAACWESDLARQVKAMEPEIRAVCTMCALRAGTGGQV